MSDMQTPKQLRSEFIDGVIQTLQEPSIYTLDGDWKLLSCRRGMRRTDQADVAEIRVFYRCIKKEEVVEYVFPSNTVFMETFELDKLMEAVESYLNNQLKNSSKAVESYLNNQLKNSSKPLELKDQYQLDYKKEQQRQMTEKYRQETGLKRMQYQ